MTRSLPHTLPFAWAALSASIALGSLAQITLKHTTNRLAVVRRPVVGLPWILLWALLFVGATACWILALSTLDISYAYPLLSLGFVLVTALAALLLHERVSKVHWVAVALISCGAAMVAGSV